MTPFVTARAPRRRRRYGARLPTALRPASWCCIPRRRRSSTARMRTGAANSRTNRLTFSVSVSERGKRCGKVISPRTASCPPPARRHSRPSAGKSGGGRFISAVTSPCKNLANMYNPYIQGWINYYGNFYRTQLRSTLKRIDLYVIRWARRKFKRLRHNSEGARDWLERLRRANPTLLVHWQLWHGNGRPAARQSR